MTAPSFCPTADRLRHLLTEAPPAAEQAELIGHLDGCPACQQTLERLAGADPAFLSAAALRDRKSRTSSSENGGGASFLATGALFAIACASCAIA